MTPAELEGLRQAATDRDEARRLVEIADAEANVFRVALEIAEQDPLPSTERTRDADARRPVVDSALWLFRSELRRRAEVATPPRTHDTRRSWCYRRMMPDTRKGWSMVRDLFLLMEGTDWSLHLTREGSEAPFGALICHGEATGYDVYAMGHWFCQLQTTKQAYSVLRRVVR